MESYRYYKYDSISVVKYIKVKDDNGNAPRNVPMLYIYKSGGETYDAGMSLKGVLIGGDIETRYTEVTQDEFSKAKAEIMDFMNKI